MSDYISNLGHDMADGCCTRGDFDSTVIEPEKYYNIENNKEGGIVNFRFVPDEDGTYYFFSDACVQTFARLSRQYSINSNKEHFLKQRL